MKPEKAHGVVARAKAKGILVVGPCELADETCYGRIEGHHDDYDKPLEVRWLCVRHHGFVHRGTRTGRPRKTRHLTENIKIKLEKETVRELRRLAREGDRTLAQEMRRALRLHVLAHQLQEAKPDAAQEEGATA